MSPDPAPSERPEDAAGASPASDDSVTRQLARDAVAGDPLRFGELYARLSPALYAWARLRVPLELRSQLDPDDVLQEVWIRAHGALAKYDADRGSFRPWLFAVAKFTLLDMIRKVRARQPRGAPDPAVSVHLSRVRDEVTSLSRRLARDEAITHFLDLAARMSEEDRLLLVHVGLEGMTVVDAAPRAGLTRDAAFKRWQRLRARLADRPLPPGLLEVA